MSMAVTQKPLIHVRVGRPDGPAVDDAELRDVRDALRDTFGEDVELVVSGSDIDIFEVPALDDYADELADRVAERLTHD